jgi:hypothetical protein
MNFVNKLFRFYGNEQKEKKEEEKNDMNNSDKALNDIKYAQYQINDMTEQIDKMAKQLSENKNAPRKAENQKKKII